MKITKQQMYKLSSKVHEALVRAYACGVPDYIEAFEITNLLEVGADLMIEIQDLLGLEVERS